ncbi:MAG: MFS transporter [Alphaproteobacteria bacterium]|nr:MFS transporter [Alphaproteobacteria bacterium]
MIPRKILTNLISFNGVSILGNALTEFAIPWLILDMTGSPAYVGILLGFKFIPVFLSSIIGGGLIDRFGSVKTSQYSDLLNFFAVGLIPLLFVYDQLDMSLLVILIFLSAILDSPGRSAKDVIFATQLDVSNVAREKANGFNSLVESAMDLCGPLLAGILISLYGVINLLWFDAFSFLIPIIGLLLLQKHLAKPPPQETTQNLREFLAGFRYIYQHKETAIIVILSAIISMALSVLLFLYLPIFANQILQSPIDQGIIMVFFATGTMSSTLLYTFLGNKFDYRNLLSFGYAGLAFSIIAINFATSLWPFAIIIGIMGLFLGFSGPLEATYLQKHVPENLRGRVFATYGGLRQLLVPISMPIVGLYLEYMRPMNTAPNVMLYMGLLLLAMVLIYSIKFRR